MALRSMELLDEVITTIRRLHQPVIAAVNGPAIGGGFCLALSADIRLPQNGHLPGRRHQQRADGGGTRHQLPPPEDLGQSRASEIMLTGRDVTADEADRIGLVSAS